MSIVIWVAIVLFSDNVCAIISIRLMWKHLMETNRGNGEHLPARRYYKVVAWIAFHALIDVFSLMVYAISQIGTSSNFGPRLKNFLGYFSTTMFAFHVAFYPIVYVLVRDLKFHEQLQRMKRSNPSPVKEVVKKLFIKTNSSSRPLATGPQSPKSAKPLMNDISE